ncbi:hypothetical protein GYB22_04730 [bacterium]|nr:hypothetical protein [bacterium]
MEQNQIEQEQGSQELYSIIKTPWRLIKEGGKIGLNSAGRFLKTAVGFGLMNMILLIYAIVRAFGSNAGGMGILWVFLMLIIGVVFTVFSTWWAYRLLLVDVFEMIYKRSSHLFMKLAEKVVERADKVMKNDKASKSLNAAVNVTDWVNSTFEKLPWVFRKMMIGILKVLPIGQMLGSIDKELIKTNKPAASAKLYSRMDAYINEKFFETHRTIIFGVLALVNLAAQAAIIYFKILG